MHLQTQTQQWLDPSRGSAVGGIDEDIQCLPLVENKPVTEGKSGRSEIVNLLRGQKVDLPDLHQIFEGWPEAIGDHVDSMRIVVDADLDKYELDRVLYCEPYRHLILSQTCTTWKTTFKA